MTCLARNRVSRRLGFLFDVCSNPSEEQGADALMLLPPYFLGPSEDALLKHLKHVISSVRIPVIVLYAPAQTGVRISPD